MSQLLVCVVLCFFCMCHFYFCYHSILSQKILSVILACPRLVKVSIGVSTQKKLNYFTNDMNTCIYYFILSLLLHLRFVEIFPKRS